MGYLLELNVSWQQYFIKLSSVDLFWLTVGLLGQLMFMLRFLVQWVCSEKSGKSIIPISFWYFSLLGGITLLAYGIYKVEPVIVIGQLPGTFVYIRNLMLISINNQKWITTRKDESRLHLTCFASKKTLFILSVILDFLMPGLLKNGI